MRWFPPLVRRARSSIQFGQSAFSSADSLNSESLVLSCLLILDLSMPVMNGFDAARKIIADDPKTGIVMFSAHATAQLAGEAKQIGIKAVVPKDGNDSLQLLLTELKQLSRERRVG